MAQHKQGIAIPGAVTSTDFARKPSAYLHAAIASGQPLVIIKRNRMLAAIVPVVTKIDDEIQAQSSPISNERAE